MCRGEAQGREFSRELLGGQVGQEQQAACDRSPLHLGMKQYQTWEHVKACRAYIGVVS